MNAAAPAEPPSALRLIPLRDVMERVGYRRTAIYSRIAKGAFPRPVRAGAGRSSRWVLSEIEQYIANAVAARDPQA